MEPNQETKPRSIREILKAEEDARMAQTDKILRGGSAAESANTPLVNTSLDGLIPPSPF